MNSTIKHPLNIFQSNKFIKKNNLSIKKYNIRQKLFLHLNNNQKSKFNKSLQNFYQKNKKKNITTNNNIFSFSSIPIKNLTPRIIEKDNNTSIRAHGIDLKIKEIINRNNKGDDFNEVEVNNKKNIKIKKQKYLQKIAQFYDSIPSLTMKNNINKIQKQFKILKYKNFGQNYHSTIRISKEDDEKKEFDKLIHNSPIIKYKYIFTKNFKFIGS